MQLNLPHTVFVIYLAITLAACTPLPTRMSLYPDGADSGVPRFWPDLPEVPRYRYAGQLTGEQNFGPEERSRPGAGERFLRWIVGLGSGYGEMPRILVRPQSGMVDSAGRILVTDTGRKAVFVFDHVQGRLHIWTQADRGEAFADPIGVVQGAQGEILVSDAGLQRVIRLREDGSVIGSFGEGVLQRPTGIAFDAATQRIFVVDTVAHDIKVFDSTGILTGRIGERGTGPGTFNAPTHITIAGARMYVTDTLNARLQVLELDGNPVNAIGRRGLYVGNFTRPKGVTVDSDGNIYVVESYYDHLLVFDQEGSFLLPIGGTGSSVGRFYLPAGVWSDRSGRIFVADMYNGRVMIFQYLGV